MNTLSSARSVNTFQTNAVKPASVYNMRHPRATSMYIPTDSRDDESRSQLLPSGDDRPSERRTQTLGRNHPLSTGTKNLTNPLFDSVGSLDQPWYRSYGQTVNLNPPQITLPAHSANNALFDTIRDAQPAYRDPSTRSLGRTSAYSASAVAVAAAGTDRYVKDPTITAVPMKPRQKVNCLGCIPCVRSGREDNSPYSLPEFSENGDNWYGNERKESPKPWVVCLLTVSTIFDLFLMVILAILVFFLNCSSDGWFYSDRRIQSICTTLWSDWIPLHHRTFRCPALPPGYDGSNLDTTNTVIKQYMNQFHPGSVTVTPAYGLSEAVREKDVPIGRFAHLESWDADMGLMPPPNLASKQQDDVHPTTTTRLYGPTYDVEPVGWTKTREQWLKLNPTAPYSSVSQGTTLFGCIVTPLVTIVVIEIASFCLTCCSQFGRRKSGYRSGQIQHMIGRLYRFSVTYIFGLLTTLLIVLILKLSTGRLRPNFITICRPAYQVCPKWSILLQTSGFSYTGDEHQRDYSSNAQLISKILAQEAAKQGFYLVPKTTPTVPITSGMKRESSFLSDTDCMEKRTLKLKYARTSFPSLSASVTMYATIFVSAYITHSLRYLRRTCFCIPLALLLCGCLANVFIGLGRVVHRENWLADILAGWALGIVIAAFVLYRALHGVKYERSVSNGELQRQLNRIQSLLQANQEYRQNEMKLMKYL